ncbi:MAG: hypothetical protein FHP94_18005 [Denitromonas halophila]|jgi:hypothetical protein|nr:MAG: hypothetical protein FHP94_18005 [Denitromonas halophila]TVT71895.1 MAG: hypothetical protein FHP93_08855 [Denitromonas halophila]
MKIFNLIRSALIATTLATAGAAVAQTAMQRPLEEMGTIRSVSPATSTIVVGDRKLMITTATKITADDQGLAYSPVSSAWVGKQIAMETNADGQGNTVVVELHLFGNGSAQ